MTGDQAVLKLRASFQQRVQYATRHVDARLKTPPQSPFIPPPKTYVTCLSCCGEGEVAGYTNPVPQVFQTQLHLRWKNKGSREG